MLLSYIAVASSGKNQQRHLGQKEPIMDYDQNYENEDNMMDDDDGQDDHHNADDANNKDSSSDSSGEDSDEDNGGVMTETSTSNRRLFVDEVNIQGGHHSYNGVHVTPPVALTTNKEFIMQSSTDVVYHEQMTAMTKEQIKGVVKNYVKTELFKIIKFIINQVEMTSTFSHFAVPIMNKMGIKGNEMREQWWIENKLHAKKALQERRATVTGSIKITVKGTSTNEFGVVVL